MATHVFIDNSNVFGGAMRAASEMSPPEFWMSVRVHYRNLFTLVEKGETVVTKVLAGSVPPDNDSLWEHARAGGYGTDLLKRVEGDMGRMVEQGVDEMLHMKIANAILDYDEAPQKLVLVGGDGKLSEFGTSFPKQVERALKRGWTVDVWSFHAQLTKAYQAFFGPYNGRIHVHNLDPYYPSITFTKGGTYKDKTGAEIVVTGRNVVPLR